MRSTKSGRGVISKLIAFALAALGGMVGAAPAPINLSHPSAYRLLMERFLSLRAGERFEGVRQSNNYVFMRDWVFLRVANQTRQGQYVLVFSNGLTEKAIAWVKPGGTPIQVPQLPPDVDQALDRAIDLTGEEFKSGEVTADGKIYMFRFKASEW